MEEEAMPPIRKGAKLMRISITGKNIEVSDYLRELALKKMAKLEKYFPADTAAQVTMAVEKNRHIVEVTIPYAGGVIRGEEVTGDMYASIDNVIAKVERQIIRYRTKLEKNLKLDAFDTPIPELGEEEDDEGPRVVRVKRFSIKPMSEEEAVLQMDLLGHSFFVFMNSETNDINVLYKRKDGNLGLIEPE